MLNGGPFTEFEIIARKAANQAFEWVQEGDREPKNVLSERETISIGRKRVMWRGRGRHRCGRRGQFPKTVTLGTIPAIASFTPNPLRNLESVFIELRNLKLSSLLDMKGCHRKKQDKEGIIQGEPWRMVQTRKERRRKLSVKEE